MNYFLKPAVFITTGSLGGLFSLLMLTRVLYPPFDWRAFLGVASFGAISGFTIKTGLRLWKETEDYLKH